MTSLVDKLDEILITLSNIETEVEQLKEKIEAEEEAVSVLERIHDLTTTYRRTH